MKPISVCLTAALAAFSRTSAVAADGALDPTFGGGTGKVQLPQDGGYEGTWQATDVAVQSTGKLIVSGWTTRDAYECFVLRLNVDGSLDTTFGGGNGFSPGYAGYGNCEYTGVAVRSDDTIVTSGFGVGYAMTPGFIAEFSADGQPIAAFGSEGSVFLEPADGDNAIVLNRIAIDAAGDTIAAGTYVAAAGSAFFIARVPANGSGSTFDTTTYSFGGSSDSTGQDLAIAPDGTFYVAGTTDVDPSLDCALAHFRFDGTALQPDASLGSPAAPGVTIAVDFGGDDADYCLALAAQRNGTLVLGGQSSAEFGGISWNVADVITQPADGLPDQRVIHSFWYDQSTSPQSGQTDTVNRVLIEPYDGKVVLVGSGPNHASSPATSVDFGVVRLSGPSTPDTSFGTNGFALYDVGSSLNPNPNYAASAVFAHSRLVIVGNAQDAQAGTDIAVIRLAPFDGIFRDGFDP